MSVILEGDLVRPLGFVTLYFAYAEAELELLLTDLKSLEPKDKKSASPHTVGTKLNHAIKIIKGLSDDNLKDLIEKLKEGRTLFSRRNTIVHSSIFAGGRMISTKENVPTEFITVDDLTKLADDIFSWKEHIHIFRFRNLAQVLNPT